MGESPSIGFLRTVDSGVEGRIDESSLSDPDLRSDSGRLVLSSGKAVTVLKDAFVGVKGVFVPGPLLCMVCMVCAASTAEVTFGDVFPACTPFSEFFLSLLGSPLVVVELKSDPFNDRILTPNIDDLVLDITTDPSGPS